MSCKSAGGLVKYDQYNNDSYRQQWNEYIHFDFFFVPLFDGYS